MARMRRDARLESRDARTKLEPRREPYWRTVERGLALGYRRPGKKGTSGSCILRRFTGNGYSYERLGFADDFDDADGIRVLDFATAQRRAIEGATAAAVIEAAGGPAGLTVDEALDSYLAWARAHSKASDRTEITADAQLRPVFGSIRVADLTTPRIRSWHQGLLIPGKQGGRPRSRSTANRVLTVLKAALNRAYEDGHVSSADAWRRVRPFREADAPRVRFLSTDECRRLVNACPADFRELVRAALLTGCRYGELVRLQVGDFHDDSGTLIVRESKGGRSRSVPLTGEGRALLERLTAGRTAGESVLTQADGAPWGKDLQARRMRDASKRAGIDPPASFHLLRHTYGSLLAQARTPPHVIAAVLGHSDTRMTSRHYAHLLPSYVADTVRANLPAFEVAPEKVVKMGKRRRG